MIHTTRPAYIDDDGNQVPALTVEVPDTLWLQVANEDGEPAAPLDWTHAHGDRIYESDVPTCPAPAPKRLGRKQQNSTT